MSANSNIKFVVAAYPYTNEMRDERNAIMEDIITEHYAQQVKGILVIGVNLHKQPCNMCR
ncbi:hypothetical protein A4R26_32950 [Niastella populi]|uniref:Uncharacterized protein n=1 Tax=Niastella populi TaxID=550983 RepID=A0A1V9GAH1_9BACT|nr:hypothetical protein A4R26_32950 [Niastella populi]